MTNSNNSNSLNNSNNKISFGTDGWRSIIADGFTFSNVRKASTAIGRLILNNNNKDYPVLVGYDTRFLANDFADECAQTLYSLGLKVEVSKYIIPTPAIAFWTCKSPNKTNGAIQFTASHNPPKYCGLKYITSYGGPAPIEMTNEITKYLNDQQSLPASNSSPAIPIPIFDPKESYFNHLKQLINFDVIKSANLKVVYDPLYGAGNGYVDILLTMANCNTIAIHNKRDPLFGGLLPEPKEEFLHDLKASVISNKAIVGLATDGDADRLAAIDSDGTFFSPNKIASMLLRHLVKNKKLSGSVVRTLSTTHLMDHLAKKYNLNIIETPIGFKWICEQMIKTSVLIGAEESGGISILNHIPDKDAILASMLLVEMLSYEKKGLKEIFNDTLKDAEWSCINDRFDLHINDTQKEHLITQLQNNKIKECEGLKVLSVNTTEGAKYVFEDGSWFLARASGTEPMARVYFEATSNKMLNAMKESIRELLPTV